MTLLRFEYEAEMNNIDHGKILGVKIYNKLSFDSHVKIYAKKQPLN